MSQETDRGPHLIKTLKNQKMENSLIYYIFEEIKRKEDYQNVSLI